MGLGMRLFCTVIKLSLNTWYDTEQPPIVPVHLCIFQNNFFFDIHCTPQAACNFASEIISFIPDPESGKVDKASPTQPPIPVPKTNAGETMEFVLHNWS